MFQSTLPRRERHAFEYSIERDFNGFNPRSHVGSDKEGSDSTDPIISFNPRSHVGSDGNGQ